MGFSSHHQTFLPHSVDQKTVFLQPENMQHKTLLSLLVLFLGFSHILSSAAVPTTRSLKSDFEDPSVQDFVVEDAADLKNGEDPFEVVKEISLFEGRMVLESADYPGTGANNHHDPKPPGKA